ncbi:hypothetical protein BV22DRAFT_248694 [Leucogyrophana mollusca]|uniref:Uncharacterized protein n=1 Tax=Leucogyrophana mollusca TaxID=85980 RepID=A0ACB8BQM7_9AGAM|nr:hypothetical protein BV22DRAFT_248694 [Leucogyrophana mollusca]
MNSPEPGSPISSDSSGSPPPDDLYTQLDQQHQTPNPVPASMLNSLSSMMPSPGSSKRRLPGGSSFDGSSSRRDAKSRRREDALGIVGSSKRMAGEGSNAAMGGSSHGPSSSSAGWSKGDHGPRRDKEELVDGPLVDQLRKVRRSILGVCGKESQLNHRGSKLCSRL